MNTEIVSSEGLTRKQRNIREQIEFIRTLAAEGKTAVEAGELMGLPVHTVFNRARRGDFKFATAASRIPIDRIIELATSGKSRREAAEILGYSYSYLLHQARKCSAPFKERLGSPRITSPGVREVEIVAARGRGETLESIGGRYGVTRERIRQICVKWGAKSTRQITDEFRRVNWTCPNCSVTLRLSPYEANARNNRGRCGSCIRKRPIELGEIIVRRRIAGERWVDIAQSMLGKRFIESPSRWAKRYLDHVNAPAETRAIVFPGHGGSHDELARSRMRASHARRLGKVAA